MFSRKKPKVKQLGKVFSLAFWLAIPCYFILGAFSFISCLILLDKYLFQKEIWALFGFGMLSSLAVIGGAELPRLRAFIHETKHALLVFMFGKSLKEFRIGKREGHVTYEIEETHYQYVPVITLAPYCFPLFSFPALAACLLFGETEPPAYALALGLTLGADISFSYSEIHPAQLDFKNIVGGFFASALYIGGVLFFWTSMCVLWLIGGRGAFLYAGGFGTKVILTISDQMRADQRAERERTVQAAQPTPTAAPVKK
ncbi:MAG: hypothetical protein U0136_09910 [Bdellovibrionota bacterium]